MEPNFVLMKLPGEKRRRVRRDPAVHAGEPEQPDRVDCRPQRRRALRHADRRTTSRRPGSSTDRCRSKRGSIRTRSCRASCRCGTSRARTCVRGSLIVIPIGRALLYAEPIYLQAERSPMPELRLVVLALQDRLAYGPTFEAALRGLFGAGASSTTAAAADTPQRQRRRGRMPQAAGRRPPPAISTRLSRGRPRPRRLPAADGGRQARRSRADARGAEAEARAARNANANSAADEPRKQLRMQILPPKGCALTMRILTLIALRAVHVASASMAPHRQLCSSPSRRRLPDVAAPPADAAKTRIGARVESRHSRQPARRIRRRPISSPSTTRAGRRTARCSTARCARQAGDVSAGPRHRRMDRRRAADGQRREAPLLDSRGARLQGPARAARACWCSTSS